MPRSFRIVCAPAHVSLVEDLLRAQGYVFQREPFFHLAYQILDQPKPLGASIAAAFGLIYIQDRSSMLSPLFLTPPQGGTVLDMCASPGSKTGLLAQLVGQTGLILANEPNERRLATLRHNLAVMNLAQVATCRYPGQSLPLGGFRFTHVLLDPPCSGWGTVERNPRIREMWPAHKIKPLITLQRDLLRKAASLLEPGGRLLYSTCTTNPEENQEQVQWAMASLGLQSAPLHLGSDLDSCFVQGIQPTNCLQIDPDAGEGQGFFFAALTAPDGMVEQGQHDADPAGLPGKALDARSVSGMDALTWENLPEGEARDFSGRVVFLPRRTHGFPESLRWQGFELGRLHGKVLRLNTRLRLLLPPYAQGQGLDIEDVRDLELLLQGQGLPAPRAAASSGGHIGRTGLYWRGLPLGWATIKGSRCLWSPR